MGGRAGMFVLDFQYTDTRATSPTEFSHGDPASRARWGREGGGKRGNLGWKFRLTGQAERRSGPSAVCFVLFRFFFSFLPVLIVAACLGGRGRCSGPSLRKMTKTRPSLLPLDTSPDATPSVLRGQGTQDLGVSKVSEAGWIEMQPEVSLLGCSLWETEEPSLPLTASLRFF